VSASTQQAILLFTMQSLKEEGSWCGETHIQKALYMCQELVGAPSNFKFILYKHGPYSFELSECLQRLIADDLVYLQTRQPYGPTLAISDDARSMADDVSRQERLSSCIRFISQKLGRKGVADLEKLATATYVNCKYGKDLPIEERASLLTSLKTHVPIDAARTAFVEVGAIETEAAQVGC
jgi:uncharacterized protein YwgA